MKRLTFMEHYVITVPNGQALQEVTQQLTKLSEAQD